MYTALYLKKLLIWNGSDVKGKNFGQKGYTQGFTVVYSLVCMSMHHKIVCIAQYFYNGEGQNFILCQ